MEIHISPESLAIVNKSCRRLGVVKLTRLVPKAMNYFFFVWSVPLWPTLVIGVHER
jgi:hypothetical protein